MSSSSRTPSGTVVAQLKTDARAAQRVAALFAETFADGQAAASLVDNGRGEWAVALHFVRAPDRKAVRELVATAAGADAAAALSFSAVAAKDWVREGLKGLGPVAAGRFVVHGAHDRARVPPNRIGIEIEAARAFGTGHHGTTRGCLLALDALCKLKSKPRRRSLQPRILDLGTGSGVLAIATARALRRRVLATDIDPVALRAAQDNARRNGAGALVTFVKTDGVVPLRGRGPFDLVFANILLAPLQRFAAALTNLAAPGARVILSGILPSQANAVIAAYHRLTLQRRIDLDDWTTLVFVRRGP